MTSQDHCEPGSLELTDCSPIFMKHSLRLFLGLSLWPAHHWILILIILVMCARLSKFPIGALIKIGSAFPRALRRHDVRRHSQKWLDEQLSHGCWLVCGHHGGGWGRIRVRALCIYLFLSFHLRESTFLDLKKGLKFCLSRWCTIYLTGCSISLTSRRSF